MSEEQNNYNTGTQPAAIIDPPRIVKTISENGVSDYQVWGWVKLSAKFIYHIRKLKGAKLAIMMTLALSVDESGKCKRTIKQLCELTDYSHTEVIDSLKELDAMGYLTVKRDAKGNIYDPEFVARGESLPSENVVKKLDSSGVDSSTAYLVDSSLSIEKSPSIPLRVKRVNTKTQLKGIESAMFGDREVTEDDIPGAEEALKAFERDMQCPGSWSWYPAKSSDEPAWKSLREFVVSLYQSDPKAFEKYYTWARDPYARGAKLTVHIRQDPTCFEYAWQAYQAANPSAGKPTSTMQVDENGVPETY